MIGSGIFLEDYVNPERIVTKNVIMNVLASNAEED